MKYDYTMLKQKFIEKGLNQSEVAAKIGMKKSTFSLKMNSISEFKQSEICLICKLLSIPSRKVDAYFFTLVV